MRDVQFQVIGCGDAFGTMGLHATCFLLQTQDQKILVDIGSGALPSLKQANVNLRQIDTIVISHYHGDHFGGLPNFLLDAKFIQQRTELLRIMGPPDCASRIWELQEAMYGSTSKLSFGFDIEFYDFDESGVLEIEGMVIQSLPVVHAPPSNPHAVAISIDGKKFTYSGDTEWTEGLIELAQGSDLFVMECFAFENPSPHHLNYQIINEKLELFQTRRILLTHLGPSMVANMDEVKLERANPGLKIDL